MNGCVSERVQHICMRVHTVAFHSAVALLTINMHNQCTGIAPRLFFVRVFLCSFVTAAFTFHDAP